MMLTSVAGSTFPEHTAPGPRDTGPVVPTCPDQESAPTEDTYQRTTEWTGVD